MMKTEPLNALEETRFPGNLKIPMHFLAAFIVFLCVASPALAVARAIDGNKTVSTRKLVAVIPKDAPPIQFFGPTSGKASGFAVDVVDRIAERAGFQIIYIAALLFITVCIMSLWRYLSLVKINRELRKSIAERKQAEEKISEQNMILEHILEQSLAGYWDWRKREGSEYLSPTFKKMFGYEDHELPNLPETWRRLIFPEDLPEVTKSFRKHVESHGEYPFYNEVRYKHRNGSTVWVICTGSVIEWDADGQPVRMIGCHVDITRLKNLEIELQKAHDELELRVEQRTMELSDLNDQLRTEIEIRKRTEEALLKSHEELESRVRERTSELADTNRELENEIDHRRKAETELISNQARLRDLYMNQQYVREEERASIAREIHDDLGQIITAIMMDVSWLKEKYSDHQGITGKASAILNLINTMIKSVRRICTELRPDVLDHLGLGAAIQWQAEEFQKRSGILCEVAVEEDIKVDNDRSIALFRIFQEALTNVLSHANATKVTASLNCEDGKVILEISDNGKGITEEEISKPGSFGLLGMRERVYPWKGSVSINGSANKGTIIKVIIPGE